MAKMPRNLAREGRGWCQHARELAAWADTHLVNRRDVWGVWIPVELRNPPGDKTRTAPKKAERGRVVLDEPKLRQHFRGKSLSALIGLHTTSPANASSRWFVYDFDAHDSRRTV